METTDNVQTLWYNSELLRFFIHYSDNCVKSLVQNL